MMLVIILFNLFNFGVKADECTPGMVFNSNAQNAPQVLCTQEQICGTEDTANRLGRLINNDPDLDPCKVLFDVPETCDGDNGKDCALIFFFHGSGSDNQDWASEVGPFIHSTTSGARIIGVYPQGTDRKWNYGGGSRHPDTDEMAFVQNIIAAFRDYYSWDSRMYAYGDSNGGGIAERLIVNGALGFSGAACQGHQLLSEPLRSGPEPYNYNLPSKEDPPATTPAAYISTHGSSDTILNYEGGNLFSGFVLTSVQETLRLWAENNGCGDIPTVTTVTAMVGTTETTAEVTTYPCDPTTPVIGYKVIDGQHWPAQAINEMSVLELRMKFLISVEVAFLEEDSEPATEPTSEPMLPPTPTNPPTMPPAPTSPPTMPPAPTSPPTMPPAPTSPPTVPPTMPAAPTSPPTVPPTTPPTTPPVESLPKCGVAGRLSNKGDLLVQETFSETEDFDSCDCEDLCSATTGASFWAMQVGGQIRCSCYSTASIIPFLSYGNSAVGETNDGVFA